MLKYLLVNENINLKYNSMNKNIKEKSDFLLWHNKKYEIDNRDTNNIYFEEKEIWFCNIGLNIGNEEDGKGKSFLRPILIIRKISKNLFIGLPLTSIEHKDNIYYYKFEYKKNVISYAILFQIKCFDSKRLEYKSGEIQGFNFLEIKEKLRKYIL